MKRREACTRCKVSHGHAQGVAWSLSVGLSTVSHGYFTVILPCAVVVPPGQGTGRRRAPGCPLGDIRGKRPRRTAGERRMKAGGGTRVRHPGRAFQPLILSSVSGVTAASPAATALSRDARGACNTRVSSS